MELEVTKIALESVQTNEPICSTTTIWPHSTDNSPIVTLFEAPSTNRALCDPSENTENLDPSQRASPHSLSKNAQIDQIEATESVELTAPATTSITNEDGTEQTASGSEDAREMDGALHSVESVASGNASTQTQEASSQGTVQGYRPPSCDFHSILKDLAGLSVCFGFPIILFPHLKIRYVLISCTYLT